MPPTPSFLGPLLAFLGLLRLAAIVLHAPVFGYGDQADMIRVSSCIGLYADVPQEVRERTTLFAPIASYVFEKPRPADCVYGSENVIVSTAVAAYRVFSQESKFDIRWIGGTKLVLAFALVAAGCVLLWSVHWAAMLHGATVLAVMTDTLTGLWFNTLYAEMPILFGAYGIVVALVAIALTGHANLLAMSTFLLGALLLGLSKVQFFLLPLVLLLLAFPIVWRARRNAALAMLFAAVLPIAIFLSPGKSGAHPANFVNTYLGALASSSPDPSRTLDLLGLRRDCANLVGGSWFRRRGEDLGTVCPEVLTLGTASLLSLIAFEPSTIGIALAREIAPSQNVFTGYLGFVEGAVFGRFELLPAWARSPWEAIFVQLRPRHYAFLLAFAGAVSLLAALAYLRLLRQPGRSVEQGMALYIAMLGATLGYTHATSVLGDGFSDAGKHLALGGVALAASMVAWLGWCISSWTSPERIVRWTTPAIIASSIFCAMGFMHVYQKLPLAFGVIDLPEGRLDAGDVEVRGWALDPFGIAALEARIGSRSFPVREGLPKPEAARIFPAFAGAADSGFHVSIPAGVLTPASPVLRIVAVNRRGVETEIDRRRLQ